MKATIEHRATTLRPLVMHFAPIEDRVLTTDPGFRYDPVSQETVVRRYAGSNDTVSYQSTSGTEPKNEADAIMDDES